MERGGFTMSNGFLRASFTAHGGRSSHYNILFYQLINWFRFFFSPCILSLCIPSMSACNCIFSIFGALLGQHIPCWWFLKFWRVHWGMETPKTSVLTVYTSTIAGKPPGGDSRCDSQFAECSSPVPTEAEELLHRALQWPKWVVFFDICGPETRQGWIILTSSVFKT